MFHFNQEHGINIQLTKNRTVATRTESFSNALVFSQRPLQEGEVFMIEITGNKDEWAGNLRCGITLHNPEGECSGDFIIFCGLTRSLQLGSG